MAKTKITGKLPAPTLAQRVASMSIADLMIGARGLAAQPEHDALCTSLLAELEKRVGFDAVDAFAQEIYA